MVGGALFTPVARPWMVRVDPRGYGRQRRLTKAVVGLAVLLVGLAACGGGARSPACTGYDALVDALRAVAAARSADTAGDGEVVERAMDDVERYIRVARARLAGTDPNPTTGAAARAMLEAANYLEFMVGDFRATSKVDFSLTQFASRELNRAASGAGGAPLNC